MPLTEPITQSLTRNTTSPASFKDRLVHAFEFNYQDSPLGVERDVHGSKVVLRPEGPAEVVDTPVGPGKIIKAGSGGFKSEPSQAWQTELTDPFTVIGWANASDVRGASSFFSRLTGGGTPQFMLRVDAGGQVQLRGFWNELLVLRARDSVEPNEWFMVSVTYNPDTLQFALAINDTRPVRAVARPTAYAGTSDKRKFPSFRIGGGDSGRAHEVSLWRMYQRTLRVSEILKHYNGHKGLGYTNF